MSVPRGLSAEEAEAWTRLASTVTPLPGRKPPKLAKPAHAEQHAEPKLVRPVAKPVMPAAKPHVAARTPPPPQPGLDSHWDRKFKAGTIQPDYTLDLHGYTLDTAYDRLMHGLDQARAMEARVVLLIAGRPRPVDPADRAERRGAIRAKLLDWLASSRHSQAISAVRKAHIRHGGEGALYLVLKRARLA
ncbi:Smr/MutS family protein [Altererythrobacter litoralis]|uniref:Smr/MutS family protein n=1 Tax=Altererythrobacter litoralis TaxID=3113904 RepID=A0ABU7GGB1_9SPHN|nr:Smr/MutS family protein [Erythrobacteraceae bacterium 1XM1-14]